MQILVVEDEALVAQDIESTLRSAGIEVYAAAGTDEALSLAERTEFDLALLDVRLGYGESGLMLAEMLLDRHAVPSLLLTGMGELPGHIGAFALGVLAKPFTPGDLVSAVQAVRAALTGGPVPAGPAGLTLFTERVTAGRG